MSITTGTGFIVTPVLGVVPPGLDLRPDPIEVADWFEAPLGLLLDPASWTTNEVFWRGATRRYLELDWQGFRIWGVTAAIIANLCAPDRGGKAEGCCVIFRRPIGPAPRRPCRAGPAALGAQNIRWVGGAGARQFAGRRGA